ncbi:GTP-binding protein [Heliobacterium chlorum]|uniref:GTP-binding protein n=1 Tax=Heliobacterium chlorum TaxID=2698 RepID=A0ABR7T2E5_HELCL|nr:CobW family GTP-binding protein [Heliobacterium chlorum]MBC9784377.1 GTP-binding protein [Heliobacterium chlorum]
MNRTLPLDEKDLILRKGRVGLMNAQVKVDIISGFLGAGKTTLIAKLLRESFNGEKVVLIENEYGEVGIDGPLFREKSVEVWEINSGCICCSLMGNFIEAVLEVVKTYSPDRIIIEPTGLAKLSDVLKACQKAMARNNALVLNMVATVVDVLNHPTYLEDFGDFYQDQIINAQTIILSKTQDTDPDRIDTVTGSVYELNPQASLISIDWDRFRGDDVLEIAELNRGLFSWISSIQNNNQKKLNPKLFEFWGVETDKIYVQSQLNIYLGALRNEEVFGKIIRGKGLLQTSLNQWIQFDYVQGNFSFREARPERVSRICFIGQKMNQHMLKELFDSQPVYVRSY